MLKRIIKLLVVLMVIIIYPSNVFAQVKYYQPYFLQKDKINKEEVRKALDESEVFLDIAYDISVEKKNKIKDKLEKELSDVPNINTLIYGIYRNDNGINILDYTKGYEVKKARMKNVYNRD